MNSTLSSRLSSITAPTTTSSNAALNYSSKQNILDRPINRLRPLEVSLSSFAYLFSEQIQVIYKSCIGISDLEHSLNILGYQVGFRVLELFSFRDPAKSTSTAVVYNKRETRLLQILLFINSTVWKAFFGKPADALEKSSENLDEYMISDNDLLINRFISVPKEMAQLNTGAFVAGIIESILDGSGFPARVTAHTVPIDGFPFRTTILMKFDPKVLEREEKLETAK